MSVIDQPAVVVSEVVAPACQPGKPVRKRKKKSWLQQCNKQVTMLMRRIHLYSGLFMFPWVLLYGFTGWFFNHPTYFSGDQVQHFAATDVADGKLGQFPGPEDLAQRVVDELNRQLAAGAEPSNAQVQLTSSTTAQFDRYLTFSVNSERESHRVQIHPITGAGEVRTTVKQGDGSTQASETTSPQPLQDITRVDLPENTVSMAQEAIPELLRDLGLSAGEATTGRGAPNLIFSATVGGVPCDLRYNLGSGSLSTIRSDAPGNDLQAKAFSQRLHLARGYAPSWGVRTLWAMSVDAMFFSMVFWGCSGIVMWWQIKRTRRWGAVVLMASLLTASFLVWGMYQELSTQRRGGRGRERQVATRSQTADRAAASAEQRSEAGGSRSERSGRLGRRP